MARHEFQTEVHRLLDIIIHSLYSHREIFLRELVSNASDALDKLRFLVLTDEAYKEVPFVPRIDIRFDEEGRSYLQVEDTGIGMNEQDLIENLGTIAKSGTNEFLSRLTGDAKKDASLIGQFGVGFYSAFMVADRVEVLTRKAGEERAFLWVSDGKGEYEILPAERAGHGTTVKLYLNEQGKEFASRWRIEEIVRRYSNHIQFPIYLHYTEEKEGKRTEVEKQLNAAVALWRRPKNEITEQEYKDFYKTLTHDDEDPLFWVHFKAEGTLEYTVLLYVPSTAPFDMFSPHYRAGVKLYVKRVFITEDDRELLPTYLRFVRGVIDSEDLPLNVSREMLQEHRILATIRNAAVKRFLQECKRIAEEDPASYERFVKEYNKPLKEGLYLDHQHRDVLLELVRFKSTKVEGYTSLAAYKERMKPDQKAVYYIAGGDEGLLRSAPILEAYKRGDIEVLIMDDEIDELLAPVIGSYQGVPLKAVHTRDAAEELGETEEERKRHEEKRDVIEKMKAVLKERVKDVVASSRLSDVPAAAVLDERDLSPQMQEILKAMGQVDLPETKPVLEVNLEHQVVERIRAAEGQELEDMVLLVYDQAVLSAGLKPEDGPEFARRIVRMLGRV